jgi:hypothetical protein
MYGDENIFTLHEYSIITLILNVMLSCTHKYRPLSEMKKTCNQDYIPQTHVGMQCGDARPIISIIKDRWVENIWTFTTKSQHFKKRLNRARPHSHPHSPCLKSCKNHHSWQAKIMHYSSVLPHSHPHAAHKKTYLINIYDVIDIRYCNL